MGLLHDLIWGKPVNGGGSEGGGGSSDFSTAEVTVIFNKTGTGSGKPQIVIPFAVESGDNKTSYCALRNAGKYDIILYGGMAAGSVAGVLGVTVTNVAGTGGVAVSSDEGSYMLTVTGNGTLTIDYTAGGLS